MWECYNSSIQVRTAFNKISKSAHDFNGRYSQRPLNFVSGITPANFKMNFIPVNKRQVGEFRGIEWDQGNLSDLRVYSLPPLALFVVEMPVQGS